MLHGYRTLRRHGFARDAALLGAFLFVLGRRVRVGLYKGQPLLMQLEEWGATVYTEATWAEHDRKYRAEAA